MSELGAWVGYWLARLFGLPSRLLVAWRGPDFSIEHHVSVLEAEVERLELDVRLLALEVRRLAEAVEAIPPVVRRRLRPPAKPG